MIARPKLYSHHLSTQSSKDNQFSRLSLQEFKGDQVFVSLKKNQSNNMTKKANENQPAYSSIKRQKSPKSNDRKTIQSTIKQLLKGKQELFNYLESQKQFIQILDVHDVDLSRFTKNRGKLTSSLTEKKKSRIDTYSTAKNITNFPFSQLNPRKNKLKKTKNQALTMEVLKKHTQSHEINQKEVFEKRQYETMSFDHIGSEENQKYDRKSEISKYQKTSKNNESKKNARQSIIISSKQNNDPESKYFVMTSPKKKKLKLNQKSNTDLNNFSATKYGLTHFSPWAFGKNQYESELGENESILEDERYSKVFREKAMNSEVKPKTKGVQMQKKTKQFTRGQNFQQKNRNIQKQTIVSENNKSYSRYQKQSQAQDVVEIRKDEKNQQNAQKDTIQSVLNEKQNLPNRVHYMRLESRKKEKSELKPCKSNVKVVNSSQVVILQSGTVKNSEIFASKQHAKYMFHPRKSFKSQLNQGNQASSNEQVSIFQTEIKTEEKQQQKCQLNQDSDKITNEEIKDELMGQNELSELKKTEEFLKEIILTKNSVSYANSRSISKKQFKRINPALQKEEPTKRSNVFMTKNLLEMKPQSQKTSRKKEFYSVTNNEKTGSRNSEVTNSFFEKENLKNQHSEKKARTSLDNPLCEKNVYEFIQTLNTKCLTEASLNGIYLINESKIRNTKNSFVRRKRHSMLVKKNSLNSNKTQSQNPKKRYSHSTQKQTLSGNIHDLSILEQSKGFGIINPLTKQLYKKYVSIVQSKRC